MPLRAPTSSHGLQAERITKLHSTDLLYVVDSDSHQLQLGQVAHCCRQCLQLVEGSLKIMVSWSGRQHCRFELMCANSHTAKAEDIQPCIGKLRTRFNPRLEFHKLGSPGV